MTVRAARPRRGHRPEAGDAGWHYDAPSAPARILLCTQSCNEVLGNAQGKIDIIFGCKTQGGAPK